MNRRQVIKKLGVGAGFLVLGPSSLSLLQSCDNGNQLKWEPVFMSPTNSLVLERILETILPSTDTPGAADLNLAQFVDSYMGEVATEEQQFQFKKGTEEFTKIFKEIFKKDIGEATDHEYHEILTRFLKSTPELSQENLIRTTETQDPLDKSPHENTDINTGGVESFLSTVRELGIWGWKNSKIIGEEVLWYDPVPGTYIPCGPVGKLGNGRAMSL